MPLPSSPACQVCGPRTDISPDSLFKCSRCQVVLYCSREHQRSHFASHKTVCVEIKKYRDEEHKIRDTIANSATYQGALDKRMYMRAKFLMIRALSTIPSRLAIEDALAEAMDFLHLFRADNLCLRYIVPTLQLLLGQYQEAYDFIKWWATTGQDDDYDFDNKELPYLDVHGADMTEALPDLRFEVLFASSLAYIKMMLAKGVKETITAYEVAGQASQPAVVTDSLGDILAPEGLAKGPEELKQVHTKLTSQLHEAFEETHARNKHFWSAMLDPMPILQMPVPKQFVPTDTSEVKMWIEQNGMLWQNHHEDIREIRRASA